MKYLEERAEYWRKELEHAKDRFDMGYALGRAHAYEQLIKEISFDQMKALRERITNAG